MGGGITKGIAYDSFGDGAGNVRTRYAYTGRERDELTGLYYYRARWYDAQVGRFISEDPIGFGGGINFYAYTANNPVNAVDPTGEVPALIPIIAAGAMILIYSEYANAPGADSPIHHNDAKREMVGDIPYMVATGVGLTKVFGLLGRGAGYCYSKFKGGADELRFLWQWSRQRTHEVRIHRQRA